MTIGLADIEAARATLAGQIVATPLSPSRTLSAITGADISLKLENLQFTGSFKDRGACNKLAHLDTAARRAGVIAMSAGNHAQGVAHHAGRFGIDATIVMPEGTPFTKINSTEVLGATVILHGQTIEDAAIFADSHAAKHGLTFVHPYDDAHVIAGQGTVGIEMLAADPDLDALIVPIGGGGLIGGIALAAKAIKPSLRIYGVQAMQMPSMRTAVYGDAPAGAGRTIADGIAVKAPGRLTRPIIERLVDDILLVEEAALEQAVLLLLEIEKTVAEGAGAAALAAVLENGARFAGQRLGLVVSGGNIDPRVQSSIILSGLVRGGRIVRLSVDIPDRPGMLGAVAKIVGETGANILEVVHQRAFSGLSVTVTSLVLVLETRNQAHVDDVIARLNSAGYEVAAMPLGGAAFDV